MFQRNFALSRLGKNFVNAATAAFAVGMLLCPLSVKADNQVIPTDTGTSDPAPCGPWNDTVYLYTTEDANASLEIYYLHCYSTTDMYHWHDWGHCLSETNIPWAEKTGDLWAPHCVYFGGKYHLYFPETASNGNFYLGHATCSSPHGTFVADAQQMVINGARTGTTYTTASIDPFIIMDTGAGGSGNNYIAWAITGTTPNRNYYGLLSPGGDSVLGTPTTLTNSSFYPGGSHYVEGQWWCKQNNYWYHIYACYYPGGAEQIGCATTPVVSGGFANASLSYTFQGWLMGTDTNSASGTLHPGAILFSNKWYLFWHCGGQEFGGTLLPTAAMRSVGADEFVFNSATTPWTIYSTIPPNTAWSVPKTYRGVGIPTAGAGDTIQVDRCNNPTASFKRLSGASIEDVNGGEPPGHTLYGISNNSWAQYDSVNFTPTNSDSAITKVCARVGSTSAGGAINIHQDSATGTLLGTIPVPSTGSLTTWATTPMATLSTKPATGNHNLALVFQTTATNQFNVNWIMFAQAKNANVFGAPTLIAPTNGATGQPAAVTLSWGSVIATVSYGLQVSTGSTFATTVYSQSGITSLSKTVSGLAGKTTYYWWANASNGLSNSAWSGIWSFTTVSTAVLTQPIAKTELPDFSIADGILSWSVQSPGEVAISLQDMLGRNTTVLNRVLSAGHYSIGLKSYNFPSGRYIVRIKTVGIEKTSAIVLTR